MPTQKMPKKGIKGLHKHIATGGKPSTYEGTKGLNGATVPGIKTRS